MYLLERGHWGDAKISHNWCKGEPTISSIKALGLQVRVGLIIWGQAQLFGQEEKVAGGEQHAAPGAWREGDPLPPFAQDPGASQDKVFQC